MADMQKKFEILEHPADVGFLAYGGTLEELFENAALAMCSLASAPERIAERVEREIRANGSDIESLLYAWLAEILAIADGEQLVFRRARVTQLEAPQQSSSGKPCLPGVARGAAYGEPFDRARHAAGTYIKAVTLHQFAVERTPQGWQARVFLDL